MDIHQRELIQEIKNGISKNTPKVVSGINDDSLSKIKSFYEKIIDTVVVVSGTKEAEMVKLLENTYRQVNIALINELAILCNMLEIDIWEVVEAAKKQNHLDLNHLDLDLV